MLSHSFDASSIVLQYRKLLAFLCHQTGFRSTNNSHTCDETDKKSNKNHHSGVKGTVPHV